MRKRLKRKRRCCAMCKPGKRGGAVRWKDRQLDRLKRDEREMRRHERY